MRVIVAEDSALLREGLVRLLEDEGHRVTAAVGDAGALLAAVAEEEPDVVVADVRMPPTHTDEGLRAAVRLRRERPGIGVLVLSQYVERRYATRLFTENTGGVGYLLKDRVMEVDGFLDALERVGAGGAAFDPEVVRQLLAGGEGGGLTERERAVLELMAQGHTNPAIAERLFVSVSAVEKHANAIFEKFGLAATPGYNRRVLAILRHLGA